MFPHRSTIRGIAAERDAGGKRVWQCDNPACGKTPDAKTDLLKCARCERVRYCSRACQKADWTVHKLMCKPIKPK